MINRYVQRKIVRFSFLIVSAMALSGSCIPTDPAEFGTMIEDFTRNLLLNAAAAFLL